MCDPDTGLVTSVNFSSPAIPITWTSSYDKYGRLIKVRETGGTLTRDKTTAYSDQLRQITTKSDLATLDDVAIQQVTLYDQLGRVRKTTDPAGSKVETRHYTPNGPAWLRIQLPVGFQPVRGPHRSSDNGVDANQIRSQRTSN